VVCMSYVMGVLDEFVALRSVLGMDRCVPATATAGQAQDLIVAHLRKNPATRHYSAASQASLALMEAWCPPPDTSGSPPSSASEPDSQGWPGPYRGSDLPGHVAKPAKRKPPAAPMQIDTE
jgi:Rap1a immunity proteins